MRDYIAWQSILPRSGRLTAEVAFGRSAKTLGGRNKAGISGQPLAQRDNHGLQVKAVLRHRPDRPARFLDGLRRDGSDRGDDNPVHRRIKFRCSVKPSSNLLKPTHLRRAGERDEIDGSCGKLINKANDLLILLIRGIAVTQDRIGLSACLGQEPRQQVFASG